MKSILISSLLTFTMLPAFAKNSNLGNQIIPEENTGKFCMCSVNTWTDYKGNVETIADFAEYSGVAIVLDNYRENMMKEKLQKVFDNHLQIWDSYKTVFTAAYEGSCDEMRQKMKAE